MALVTEDGSGKADAESFASVEFADQYHSARGNASWDGLTDPQKEAALRKATDYIGQQYGERWKGERASSTQALDWPRYCVMVDGFEVGADTVPNDVQKATASLALRSVTAPLSEDITQAVKREKIGTLEVEYQDYSSPVVRYREIDGQLRKYLSGGSGSIRVVRA